MGSPHALVLLPFLLWTTMQDKTPPLTPLPSRIVPDKASGKVGKQLVITSLAEGKTQFIWDEDVFDAVVIGKVLSAVPQKEGTFVIHCVGYKEERTEKIVIIIGQKIPDPLDPPPAPDLTKLIEEIKALTGEVKTFGTRLSSVEKSVVDLQKGVPPKVKAAHLTFIGAEKTPAATATNNDAVLRQWLKDAGIKVHVLTAEDPGIAAAGLGASIKKAGGVPCVVAQDESGNVLAAASLTTADAVKALVGK